jgi:hypothetical protein
LPAFFTVKPAAIAEPNQAIKQKVETPRKAQPLQTNPLWVLRALIEVSLMAGIRPLFGLAPSPTLHPAAKTLWLSLIN